MTFDQDSNHGYLSADSRYNGRAGFWSKIDLFDSNLALEPGKSIRFVRKPGGGAEKPAGALREVTMAETADQDAELDARGLMCPEPVMMLHNRIADVPVGGVLRVLATDPSTTRDIPRFCQFLNHELLRQEQAGDQYLFWIRRGA
jgi:tRNA 2-thiouridine synthesizing protein A